MRAVFAFICLVVSALAQDHAAMSAAQSACGPAEFSFSVIADKTQHPVPQPDSGKALVVVVENLGQCQECAGGHSFITDVSSAVVRIGADSAWVGANRGNSYFFFAVPPGEHHLCANWQSRLEERSQAFAMANFRAEAGKVYYFRVRLFPGEADFSFDLDLVNTDEGKYLVASSPYSVSHVKK